ncbi:MAG: rplP0 [Thermoplasmatales archaeon]|nr:rplP0 [Thermoplasmatales archaeon]
MAHVATWKHGEVSEISSLMTHHKIIGILDIGGIPAPQLQQMRGGIRSKAQIRASKNTLILKALDEAETQVKGISALKNEVHGQAAVIATDINPFALYREIKATRKNAPAKGGETASHDIEVQAGDTPFKPGPIVGELQKAGIPAAIAEGKVVIKTDKVLVEAGQKISRELAQMLSRIEIFPIEIGLKLNAVYENGEIYRADVLDIDMDRFMGQLRTASFTAVGLAMETGWTNPQTIRPLLAKAYRSAHTLAVEKNIYTKETMEALLAKAQRSMLSVSSQVKPVSKEGEKTPT